MCVFAVLLWVIIKGDLGEKKNLYLSGNFGNVCREMVSNMNKAAQSGGTLSEQLGLNTTAACDSCLLAFPEHCTWKPVTISAMIWGHQGLLGSRLLFLLITIQKHYAVAYWGPFFFAPPGWGFSVAGMLPGWYGRTWHCFLEQHQGCPLAWQHCHCTKATALLGWQRRVQSNLLYSKKLG